MAQGSAAIRTLDVSASALTWIGKPRIAMAPPTDNCHSRSTTKFEKKRSDYPRAEASTRAEWSKSPSGVTHTPNSIHSGR